MRPESARSGNGADESNASAKMGEVCWKPSGPCFADWEPCLATGPIPLKGAAPQWIEHLRMIAGRKAWSMCNDTNRSGTDRNAQ